MPVFPAPMVADREFARAQQVTYLLRFWPCSYDELLGGVYQCRQDVRKD